MTISASVRTPVRFSAALCRGLIEAISGNFAPGIHATAFSAALCRGLIEAARTSATSTAIRWSFPRLYAAASLKREPLVAELQSFLRFPRLYAAASLKRGRRIRVVLDVQVFSAALCRGLIEARAAGTARAGRAGRFSAALCRGLIEASGARGARRSAGSFSAALCRGLIEASTGCLP